jgi:ornithine cyclodeaminase/alanine dehydrogenase-like protein (mu-crystallin family)
VNPPATLILTRADVARLLSLDAAIAAVEEAFRAQGQPGGPAPAVLHVPAAEGGFHVKAARSADGDARSYFAAKVNANFPGNPARHGLPLVQGVVVLADGERGTPLAVMDSMELTALRTAAATAVAARHLAREDARVAVVVGCGVQGRLHLRALARVRTLERAFAVDVDLERARRVAREAAAELGIPVAATTDLAAAARQADLLATCTPAARVVLRREDVRAGTFVAGVGADNPDKQELDPKLLAAATVVVDSLEQCAAMGDLHHALAAGALTREDVYAELGEVVAGGKPGRRSAQEITVFDSTGVASADVAAAAAVYDRALAAGAGVRVRLGLGGA